MTARNALLHRLLPFLRWRRQINGATLKSDLGAGLIGACIALPQGVAFATLAGLPPEYGLYAAMLPVAVAALWGSSSHLVSGPTNAISLVVFATISPLAEPGSGQYVTLVLTVTLMVGVLQLVMGLARLGALVNFISPTVVVGFTAGAALLIIASQVKNFFGIDLPPGATFFGVLAGLLPRLGEADGYAVFIGAVTLAAAIATRRWLPKIPYMISAMLAGGVAAYALNWHYGAAATGIRTVGALEAALAPFSLPDLSFAAMRELTTITLATAAVGLTQSVSIARAIAMKSGQRIDGNQEFVGQGLANICAAFFSGYVSSGSFNRSAVNHQAGARTPLAAVFSAALLVAALFIVAPLVAFLPLASMAAILFLVAWSLFDFRYMRRILGASRAETSVLATTCIATLVLPLELAILLGVLLSLMLYLHRTAQPRVRLLAPDPNDAQRKFRDLAAGQPECPQLGIVRIEGSIYFGAVQHVGEELHQLAQGRPQQRHLLLMAKSINFVDVAGADLIAQEARRRRANGGRLWLYSVREAAAMMLRREGFVEAIGADAFFDSKRSALAHVVPQLDPAVCASCRARIFVECASRPAPASLSGA